MSKNKLRFKDADGDDYPEWAEKTLDEVAECLDSKRKPLNSSQRSSMVGDVPYYGANNIQGYVNKHLFEEPLVLLAEDGGNFDDYQNKPIAQYIKGKSWVNNHAHVIKGKNISTKFLFYSLVHKDIRSFINGTSRAKLNKSDMLKIEISVPSLPEQEKIAALFSKLDERIELREQKLASLKEYKKGLQQAVFGKNGERTLRFKDKNGNDYPEWKKVTINSISTIKSSGDLSKIHQSKEKSTSNTYPVYGNGLADRGLLGYSNKYEYDKAVTVTGRGDIGVAFLRTEPFVAVGRLLVLTTDENNVNLKFLQESISMLKILSESTGVPQLTAPAIGMYEIMLPCLEEQAKIANLFSKIDNQIELEERLLQAAKDEKQGLMQRVF